MKKLKVTQKQYNKILYTYRLTVFLSIIAILVIYSLFINKLLEFVLIFLPYFITKNFYKYQYHASSTKQCFALSIIILAFLTTITFPIKYSIIASVFVGLGVAYISYYIGNLQHQIEVKQSVFNTDTCTETELIKRCRELHFSEENTNLAIEFFIKKTKHSILADKLYIEEKSITTRKKRMKALLNK